MNNWRKILFPFSLAYDGVTRLRNLLYDNNLRKIRAFETPVICVGNLSVGGTGKSPMIEFLIEKLQDKGRLAVLSRGYKRATDGFVEVKEQHSAREVGDEPLQFKRKFPHVTVAVDANRRRGIGQLEAQADIVLLDDAYQHRRVRPAYSILLTTYQQLYTDDLLLPAGNLREAARGARRANCIVVTKCPENLSETEQVYICKKLNPTAGQQVYFATIAYADILENEREQQPLSFLENRPFTLVTGIANPKPLLDYLHSKKFHFEHLAFPDHHAFSEKEVRLLEKKDCILTTEKDFTRLHDKLINLYYLPIKTRFLGKEEAFLEAITQRIIAS